MEARTKKIQPDSESTQDADSGDIYCCISQKIFSCKSHIISHRPSHGTLRNSAKVPTATCLVPYHSKDLKDDFQAQLFQPKIVTSTSFLNHFQTSQARRCWCCHTSRAKFLQRFPFLRKRNDSTHCTSEPTLFEWHAGTFRTGI